MTHHLNLDGLGDHVQLSEHQDHLNHLVEVPQHLELLPDGRESLVLGDPERCAEFNHDQGCNDLGFRETCGIVSCEDILKQFGVHVTENDLVHHAVENHECDADADKPERCGGTTVDWQAKILTDKGVPAHAEAGESLENLAESLEQGHGVIAEVNCGVLWNDARYYDNGGANHAITITGVARDPQTGAIQGFFINDSGTGHSNHFVSAEIMAKAWLVPDGKGSGSSVVTDSVLHIQPNPVSHDS